MDNLQLRENEIFKALKALDGMDFVLIGGYAANAYALPRFSVDCDIVIRKKETYGIAGALKKIGYQRTDNALDLPYHGEFVHFEKESAPGFFASVDILVDNVHDRQTGVSFDVEWIFSNSRKRQISGKTIMERLGVRVINPEALFVMKFISARVTDIRDVFMMADKVGDFGLVKKEIASRVDFKRQFEKITGTVMGRQFKDNLQGVYGYIDERVFEKHMKLILGLDGAMI